MRPARYEEIPRFIEPMLASTRVVRPGEEWAFEVKWDGARMQVRFDGRAISMRSRQGRGCADEFPEVAALAEALVGRRIVLDGELVCFAGDGKPNFAALRARFGRCDPRAVWAAQRRSPVRLIVFDVLHLDGRAVRELPYARRRELLEELSLDGPAWCTPRHFLGAEGEALIAATADQGLEGVVAKRLDAPYMPGRRSTAWIKRKHRRREWFVIAGWRERPGALPEFLLSRRQGGDLVPAGSASLGLDGEQRTALIAALSDHELPHRSRRGSVRWAEPLIEVSADVHGPPDGPVRDPILREIVIPASTTNDRRHANPSASATDCAVKNLQRHSHPGPRGRMKMLEDAGVARDAVLFLVPVSPTLVWRVGLPGPPDCREEHACQVR